jgi:uncharacterized protein YndB with AHSA1/START domain
VLEVVLEDRIAAPCERVWELVADHEAMPRWFPAREVIRRRPGSPCADGEGARRVIRIWGLAVEEAVTVFKPPERLETKMLAGAPLSEHRSELVLQPVAGGTHVRWCVRLHPRIPGTARLIERVLTRTLRKGLEGLRRAAEQSA